MNSTLKAYTIMLRNPDALRLLELLGYNLVSVPFWEWDELQHDRRAQEEYLTSRLAIQEGEF